MSSYCGPVFRCAEASLRFAHGCCEGTTLHFGHPLFTYAPYVAFDDNQTFTASFLPDYLTLLTHWMGSTLRLSVSPPGPRAALGLGPEATSCLIDRTCNVVLSTLDQASNHELELHRDYIYTSAIMVEGFATIVLKSKAERKFWDWTLPFEGSLWLAVLVFALVTPACMVVIARRKAPAEASKQLTPLKAIYRAVAAILGGEEWYDEAGLPGRVLRLGLLLMVLVLEATYTANLAACVA